MSLYVYSFVHCTYNRACADSPLKSLEGWNARQRKTSVWMEEHSGSALHFWICLQKSKCLSKHSGNVWQQVDGLLLEMDPFLVDRSHASDPIVQPWEGLNFTWHSLLVGLLVRAIPYHPRKKTVLPLFQGALSAAYMVIPRLPPIVSLQQPCGIG